MSGRVLSQAARWIGRGAATAALVFCGCVINWSNPQDGGAAGPSYTGPECDGKGKEPSADEQLATMLLCGQADRLFGYQGKVGTRIEKMHGRFDDRRFDHLRAGLMLHACAVQCEDDGDQMSIGMLEWFAQRTEPEKMRSGMASWSLGDSGKSMLVERVAAAKQNIASRAGKLDARRRRLYVEIPNGVRERRQAYFRQYAPFYERLDALIGEAGRVKSAGRDAAATVASFEQLRADYYEDCEAADCRFDPLPTELSRELVLLHLATRNDLGALAEWELFLEPAPYRNAYAPSVHLALYLAMKKEADDYQAYAKMKAGGADEATLTARFGTPPPVEVTPDAVFEGGADTQDLVAGVDRQPFEPVTGILRQVREAKQPGLVELVFQEDVRSYEPTDCSATDRVAGMDLASGRLVYEQSCRSVAARPARERVPPVLVPKRDAESLAPLDEITALVGRGERQGLVVRARSKAGKLVQHRSHRLDPTLDHPPMFRGADR